ncbi:MAG: hypothetical protein R2709_13390 [Marmoricola sp.]
MVYAQRPEATNIRGSGRAYYPASDPAFGIAIVPVVSEQIATLIAKAPEWFASLEQNHWVNQLNEQYDVITKIESYLTSADLAQKLFGGVVGVGSRLGLG